MKKLFLLPILILVSCSPKPVNRVVVIPVDSIKQVSYEFAGDSAITFEVDSTVSDAELVKYYQYLQDSIQLDELRKDSIEYENFKRITKIINGGYNGLQDRVNIWNRAKKILNESYERERNPTK